MPAIHDETAPGDLELVRTFINTADLQRHTDAVSTPETLRAWLAEHELLDATATVTPHELARAANVREALRELAGCEDCAECADEALRTLAEAAARAPLALAFGRDRKLRLEPIDRGVDGAMARLLAIVHRAVENGDWPRLKLCKDEGCRWAFFDHSKNRSGAWCDMATCGNRNKARRRRATAGSGGSAG